MCDQLVWYETIETKQRENWGNDKQDWHQSLQETACDLTPLFPTTKKKAINMGSTTLLNCNKQLVNLPLDYGRQKDDECSLAWFKAFQKHWDTYAYNSQLTGFDLRHTPFWRTYSQKERASQSWKRPTVIRRQMNRVRVDSRDSQFVRVNVRFYKCPQILIFLC